MAQLGMTQNCIVNWVLRGGFKLKGTANPVAISGPIWADQLSFRALTGAYHDPASREVIGTPPGRVNGRVVIRPDALRFENLHGKLPHTRHHVHRARRLRRQAQRGRQERQPRPARRHRPDGHAASAGRGGFTLDVGRHLRQTDAHRHARLRGLRVLGRPASVTSRRAPCSRRTARRCVFSGIEVQQERLALRRRRPAARLLSGVFARGAARTSTSSRWLTSTHRAGRRTTPTSRRYQGARQRHGPGALHARVSRTTAPTARWWSTPTSTCSTRSSLRRALRRRHARAPPSPGATSAKGTRGARLDLRELHLTKGRGCAVGARHDELRRRAAADGARRGPARARSRRCCARAGSSLEGELNLAGTVRGSLEVPEASLDLELVGMQLGGRLLGDGNAKLQLTHKNDPWVQKALRLRPRGATVERAVSTRAGGAGARQLERRARPPTARVCPAQAVLVCGPLLRDRVDADLAFGLDPEASLRGARDLQPAAHLVVHPRERGQAGRARRAPVRAAPTSPAATSRTSTRWWAASSSPSWRSAASSRGSATTVRSGSRSPGAARSVESARFVGAGTQIAFRGGASLAEGLAASIAGTLDLSILSTFVPSITRSSGMLGVDVKLTGVFRDPSHLRSRRDQQRQRAHARCTTQPLEAINAKLSFSEREILLEELSASFAGGDAAPCTARRRSRGAASSATSSSLDARDVSIQPSPGIELTLGVETTLVGGASMRAAQAHGQRAHPARALHAAVFARHRGAADGLLAGQARRARGLRPGQGPPRARPARDRRRAAARSTTTCSTPSSPSRTASGRFASWAPTSASACSARSRSQRGTLRFRSSEFRIEDGHGHLHRRAPHSPADSTSTRAPSSGARPTPRATAGRSRCTPSGDVDRPQARDLQRARAGQRGHRAAAHGGPHARRGRAPEQPAASPRARRSRRWRRSRASIAR